MSPGDVGGVAQRRGSLGGDVAWRCSGNRPAMQFLSWRCRLAMLLMSPSDIASRGGDVAWRCSLSPGVSKSRMAMSLAMFRIHVPNIIKRQPYVIVPGSTPQGGGGGRAQAAAIISTGKHSCSSSPSSSFCSSSLSSCHLNPTYEDRLLEKLQIPHHRGEAGAGEQAAALT